MARGIDIFSAYQNVHNWRAVRQAGYEFAYIKLSDGTTTRNEAGYAAGARTAGVWPGGYHYSQPGDPVAQANLFIDRCEATGATALAPALDIESPFTPGRAAQDFAARFVRQVQARGHRPCVYANDSMMSSIRGAVLGAAPDCWLWVARYASNYSTEPSLRPSGLWHVHQYSQAGQVPGITASATDLNDGSIPFNVAATTAGAPAGPDIHILDSEDCDVLIPAGGSEGNPANYPLAPSLLREHDLIVAPGDEGVALYAFYNWGLENDRGLGRNPFDWNNPYIVWPHMGGTWIIPQGTAKVDMFYWSKDNFTVSLRPR